MRDDQFDATTSDWVRRGSPSQNLAAKLFTMRHTTISSDSFRHVSDRLHDASTFASAIAYLRVSTGEQGDSGLGIEAQRTSVLIAADRLGRRLRDVYIDVAHGDRAITKRPVLMQAVAALQRGDVLFVAKRDRLARDRYEIAIIDRAIKKQGARVLSAAGEGTEDDDPASVLFRGLLDLFAEYERLIIVARTKAGLAVKRARGERCGQLPFGFELAPDGRQLQPAPVEQRLLSTILELRAAGYSTRQIADELNGRGHTTRKGTAWRFQYVARQLQNGRGES